MNVKRKIKNGVQKIFPVGFRKNIACWLNRQGWFPGREILSGGLIGDLHEKDPKTFHKFLWSNHFSAYSKWYDSEVLFNADKMEPSRKEFFRDVSLVIKELNLVPPDFRSVLEVGCSLGYLLHFLEKGIFKESNELVGIDIDGPAIDKGRGYLERIGSKVNLIQGDMENLNNIIGEKKFDFVFAAGVLSYLNETDALDVIRKMLFRTKHLLALVGLAHTVRNNNELQESEISPSHHGQWIHNFEKLVNISGGKVVKSRWEGAKQYNFQTICFVFAVPPKC